MPERPEELESERTLSASGTIFVGDKGKIICGEYSGNPRIIPESKMKEYKRPPRTIPRIEKGADGHEQDWVRACKGGPAASSNFDYSGPFTEAVVMGNFAVLYPERKLLWDGENMKFTNDNEANELLQRPYRQGWTL